MLLLFWPRGVHQCEMEALYIAPDWGAGERPPFWDTFIPIFDGVLDEDMVNLAPIQRSLNSGAFTGMMLNYQERRIYWFHEEIDRRIGAKNIPVGLAVKIGVGTTAGITESFARGWFRILSTEAAGGRATLKWTL